MKFAKNALILLKMQKMLILRKGWTHLLEMSEIPPAERWLGTCGAKIQIFSFFFAKIVIFCENHKKSEKVWKMKKCKNMSFRPRAEKALNYNGLAMILGEFHLFC